METLGKLLEDFDLQVLEDWVIPNTPGMPTLRSNPEPAKDKASHNGTGL